MALLAGLPGLALGDASVVWLALSEKGGAYAEAEGVLLGSLAPSAARVDLKSAPWQDFAGSAGKPPALIVTLGALAFRGMLDKMQKDPGLTHVPILAALLPRKSYEALAPRAPLQSTAIFLDQPTERYLDLIRLAMPERRRIAVLLGPDSQSLRPALLSAAAARGMKLTLAQVDSDDLYPVLSAVLEDSDVLLALPDSRVYNPHTLQNILITSYRRRMPTVSYSAASVKAGATLALFTSPTQAAQQTAAAIRSFVSSRTLPPPRPAADYSVALNAQVTHSLDLALEDAEHLSAALRKKEELR